MKRKSINYICRKYSELLIITHYSHPWGNEGALEVAKISCCDGMFLGRIKSGLLYLIHLK